MSEFPHIFTRRESRLDANFPQTLLSLGRKSSSDANLAFGRKFKDSRLEFQTPLRDLRQESQSSPFLPINRGRSTSLTYPLPRDLRLQNRRKTQISPFLNFLFLSSHLWLVAFERGWPYRQGRLPLGGMRGISLANRHLPP